MAGIKILGTGRYVPEKVVDNNDYAKIVETTDEWISTRTGIRTRHIASVAEPTWYMGAQAARAALESSGVDAADVDMIIVTTVTADFITPSTACIIQMEIGASNAFAFDINVACAGLAYALDMAHRYLSDEVKTVLIVNAESLSQITNYADRTTCVLFGDGAGACVLTASEGRFASYLRSDAAGAGLIYAKYPRRSSPFFETDEELLEPFPKPLVAEGVYQNGREVYKFATKVMPLAVEKACQKLGISPGDLSLIIPHQANYRIIETGIKNLGLPEDKFYVNIQEYGNTSSASIAIGLDECVRSGRISRGDLVCAVGFGAGLIYGASIFEY